MTCWFTFAFSQSFAKTEHPLIFFRASDSIWVYFNNRLVYSTQGWVVGMCIHPSVGIAAEKTLSLSTYVAGLSGSFYTIHVFASSRSCITQSDLFSIFHWRTSAPPQRELEPVLNFPLAITANNTNHTNVVWEGTKAIMGQGSVIQMEALRSDFYRFAMEFQFHSYSVESAMCIVIHGIQSMTPSTVRHGINVQRSTSSPCTMNGAMVAFMLTMRCTLQQRASRVAFSWIGYDDAAQNWVVYRVPREGVLNERVQVRVDLNVLYGYVRVFMKDMVNALMSSDEVCVAAVRDA